MDIGFDNHFCVKYGAKEFASGERHIKGVESFWIYAKMCMAMFDKTAPVIVGVAKDALEKLKSLEEIRFVLASDIMLSLFEKELLPSC